MTSTTMTTSTLPSPPTSLTRPRAGIGAAYGFFWRRMPRELAYLALTTVIGLASLAALRGSFSSAIGVLVFAAVFVVTRYLGLFELRRQRWTGMPDIPAPQWTPPFRGKGFFRILGDVFGNAHSWLYYLHSGILNPVLAVITTAIWLPWMLLSLAFSTAPIWASTSPYGPGATLTLNQAGLVRVTGSSPPRC